MIDKIKSTIHNYKFGKILLIIVLLALLYILIPQVMMDRPQISEISPSIIMVNSNFNENKSITLTGKNFDNIVAIYINDVWEPDCTIISNDTENIIVNLPNEYYLTADKLKIQVQTKINSDLFAKSNKQVFTVLSDEGIEKPKITSIKPETLRFNGNLYQTINVFAENITNDSKIMVDDVLMDTELSEDCLTIHLPYSVWCNRDSVQLRIIQYCYGYPSSIQSARSYIPAVTSCVSSENIEMQLSTNEEIMLNYLTALNSDDYIVIFSVCDESSCDMTKEIVNAMHKLGLKKDLITAGIHNSYISVLNGKELLYEQISKEALYYDNNNLNCAIHVESLNFDVGGYSSIQIDGVEYSLNRRGLNIVVYDKKSSKVIDSVCFDTYENLSILR